MRKSKDLAEVGFQYFEKKVLFHLDGLHILRHIRASLNNFLPRTRILRLHKIYDVTDSSICDYVINCGYPLWKIENVLREQDKLHPGRIYLGSVNGYYGDNPKLWQHYHVVVFIPCYEKGELKIAVLERNKETSFSYLLRRYPNTFCHLVGFSSEGEFKLMEP